MSGISQLFERVVGGIGEVGDGVQQRSVKIKNHVLFHKCLFSKKRIEVMPRIGWP